MKILHVIPNLKKGGAERLALDICIELQNQGHEVVLVSFKPENEYQFLSELIDYRIIPSKVEFSIKGKNNYSVESLQSFIEEFQPEVIHSHLFESETVLSGISYDSAHYVVHFHDNMPQFKKASIKTFFNKSLFTNYYERKVVLSNYSKRKVSVIAISKDTYNYVQNNLPNEIPKHLLYNAINVKRFINNIHWEERQNRAVMIGSLVPKKGQELAIRTIKELNKKGIDLHIDLLGNGPLRKELEVLAIELGIENFIHFHGNVDTPENFLQNAQFYIHTASYEPFGLVLLEAMAAGCPIVCTNGGGNADLISNEENGFIFSHRIPEEYADKIIEILNSPQLRNRLIENGKLTAQNFDINPYTHNLVQLYKNEL